MPSPIPSLYFCVFATGFIRGLNLDAKSELMLCFDCCAFPPVECILFVYPLSSCPSAPPNLVFRIAPRQTIFTAPSLCIILGLAYWPSISKD